jgi:hypothetical protein
MSVELRLAVTAAFALFVSMFLPWYEKSYFANVKGRLAQASDGLNAFQAFSFVEAAVLLVAVAVIALCFARGERKPFHLPGGDGAVIMAAGGWVGLLLVYRLFDKPNASVPSGAAVTVGIQWGIFFAIAAAAFLVYTGYRIYHAHRPEPPLPGEVDTGRRETRATEPLIRDQRPRSTPAERTVPDGPPSAEARAAADRAAAGRGSGERAASERRASAPLPGTTPPVEPVRPESAPPRRSVTEEFGLEPPAPDLPPEWPHAAGSPPEWPDLRPASEQAADDPPPDRAADDDDDPPTAAMPGRRRPAKEPARDEPPREPPDTLF